jgi:hypothetical protein
MVAAGVQAVAKGVGTGQFQEMGGVANATENARAVSKGMKHQLRVVGWVGWMPKVHVVCRELLRCVVHCQKSAQAQVLGGLAFTGRHCHGYVYPPWVMGMGQCGYG